MASDEGEETLGERLQGLAENRGLTAAEVVRRAARETHGWLCAGSRVDAGIGALLRGEQRALIDAHD